MKILEAEALKRITNKSSLDEIQGYMKKRSQTSEKMDTLKRLLPILEKQKSYNQTIENEVYKIFQIVLELCNEYDLNLFDLFKTQEMVQVVKS